jgi:hypothetical protein
MSAEEWQSSGGRPGAPGTMKVETRGMAFNRASVVRREPTKRCAFVFGWQRADGGAEYHSEEGTLRLQRNVKLNLDRPPANRKNAQNNRTKSQSRLRIAYGFFAR